MLLTQPKFLEFKKELEQKHGKQLSDNDVQKCVDLLELMAEAAVEITIKECGRLEKLKKFPNGFHLEDSEACTVCGKYSHGSSWFDKYGIKCMTCQNAIDKKIIPRLIGKYPESFYKESELQIYFNLKGKVLNRFIKTGVLKVRVVPGLDNSRHLRVFLLKDNKSFLPPKKILSSHLVKDDRNGQEGYALMPWYYFHDPKKHLKKYGISAFLKIEYSARDQS